MYNLERLKFTCKFSELVASRRKALGLSYEELDHAAGLLVGQAERIESKDELPHPTRLWSMCEVLDLEPSDVLWALQGSAEKAWAPPEGKTWIPPEGEEVTEEESSDEEECDPEEDEDCPEKGEDEGEGDNDDDEGDEDDDDGEEEETVDDGSEEAPPSSSTEKKETIGQNLSDLIFGPPRT